jgi:thioredoxin reductase (NADPH)
LSIHSTDVAIIGAGPVGLFAVFECGMARLKCHVIDALDMVGGQCAALYPEKPIYDIPAHASITGADLIDNLAAQAAPFHPVYHLDQQVMRVEKQADGRFRIETSLGTVIEAVAVIIAAGVGAFGPNRPPLENLDAFEGKSVFYYVKKRQDYAGKNVVIAGGGDSAVDWAISLAEVAKRVMVVHRRDKFRCAPESSERLHTLVRDGIIDLVVPYQLEGLVGENGQLRQVVVADMDGKTCALEADVLLPFFGLAMTLGPIAEWGLDLAADHIAIDPATCQTSEPGIYAIGDIAHYAGKLKLILQGFSEAAVAAHAALKHIRPHETVHFEYSTTKGVPGAAS